MDSRRRIEDGGQRAENGYGGQIRISVSGAVTAYSELSGAAARPVRDSATQWTVDSGQKTEGGFGEQAQTAVPTPHDRQRDVEGAVPYDSQLSTVRYIGEALGGYLLAETSDGLALIDKHAAHERILFNRLKEKAGRPMAQTLLSPLTVSLPPVEASLLLEHAELLSGMGFAVEAFGGETLAVREAPADVDVGDILALLGEIAVRLREGRRDPEPQLFDDVLHLVACKAAIKVGRPAGAEEAESLARTVLGDPSLRHCPHGRPICIVLSRGDIEKQFRR